MEESSAGATEDGSLSQDGQNIWSKLNKIYEVCGSRRTEQVEAASPDH